VASSGSKLLFAGRMEDEDSISNCVHHWGNVCHQPAPPPGSHGMCGWNGVSTWRSASCGGSAGLYDVPPGFVTAVVEISTLANPADTVSRTVVFPARLPEVDVRLSFPELFNTSHLETDKWLFACQATVNGKSVLAVKVSGQDEVCLTPHHVKNDEFIAYGGEVQDV